MFAPDEDDSKDYEDDSKDEKESKHAHQHPIGATANDCIGKVTSQGKGLATRRARLKDFGY